MTSKPHRMPCDQCHRPITSRYCYHLLDRNQLVCEDCKDEVDLLAAESREMAQDPEAEALEGCEDFVGDVLFRGPSGWPVGSGVSRKDPWVR
jgi:hypothetical protein